MQLLYNMNKKFNKRSQSEVITTILLVLLSIVAVGIVISFVYPFVQNQISGSDCVYLVGQIQVTNNQDYTCYNPTTDNLSIQIHVGDLQDKANGFIINVGSGGSSVNYQITSTSLADNVSVSGSNVPGKDEERTYIINSTMQSPDIIKVYPILNNGKSCDSSSSYSSVVTC